MSDFRWLIKKNIVTAAVIYEYSRANELSFRESERFLENEQYKVLQYRSHTNGWVDVPTVIEPSPIQEAL